MAALKYFDRISGLWRTLPPGAKGDPGDKGDKGDPTIVNGKTGASITLDAADVGADASGSASAALTSANNYTDSAVSTLNSSLGTAAFTPASNYATAAQGAKADTAVQTETDPTVPAWAKTPSKPTYDKSEVGLGNVDNTSDADKSVSTATQTALDGKVDKTGGVMTGSLTATTLTAGTATDALGTALSVIRNNVAVGRIDNNASGLRVQAQNGSLQLRGTGNTGISIDASGNAVVAGTITGANLSGTNTGDQVGDGVTITGAGTELDPFVSVNEAIWGGIAGDIADQEDLNTLLSERIPEQTLFIQDTEPTVTSPSLWVETASGAAKTLWIVT